MTSFINKKTSQANLHPISNWIIEVQGYQNIPIVGLPDKRKIT